MSTLDEPSDGSFHTIDGRFELERMLGMGGMGEVWRAKQMPLGRLVALKLLRQEYSLLPHLRRRFAREARAAARLNHEHIASVFDFGTDDQGRMFIAMEYVEGPPLVEMVYHGLSVKHVVELGYQLLDALAHAHARGVIHRDLKPENVLISKHTWPRELGDAKIVDFGIAKVYDERQSPSETGHDQVVGTPLYMSPEQAGGQRDLSPATDLYSLGLILYEALAGKHPFAMPDSLAVMTAQIQTPLPPLVPRPGIVVPPVLESIILKALKKQVGDRWSSAAQMRAELEPLRMLVRTDSRYARLPSSLDDSKSEANYAKTEEVDMAFDAVERKVDTRVELPSKREGAMMPQSEFEPPNRKPSIPSLRETPFVGRQALRDQLLEVASQMLMDHQGLLLLLGGEAGVGKTRLVRWFKEVLEERGLFVGHAGVFSRAASDRLGGLQEVFESLFRTRGLMGEALTKQIHERLKSWGAMIQNHDVMALERFLRPQSRDTAELPVKRQASSRLFASLSSLLAAACHDTPRLVVLEDVHWASEELLSFLDYLSVEFRQRDFPLLLIGTMRQEEVAKRPELQGALEMMNRYMGEVFVHQTLGPMPKEESRELVRSLLPASEDLTSLIVERAAGNPLHLLMLTRYLSNQELLEVDEEGVWGAKDNEQAAQALPPSLADLFKLKLKDLTRQHKKLVGLLIRCAILGRKFSYEVLEKMGQLEAKEGMSPEHIVHLDTMFDTLLHEGLITEDVGGSEEWYSFRYSLLRDVLLQEEIGPATRRRLHRLAAVALESVYAQQVDGVALDVARHWREAKKSKEAIGWAWRGAQSARRAYRLRDALGGYLSCIQMMNQRLDVEEGSDAGHFIFDRAKFEAAGVGRSRYLRGLVYAGDLHEGFGQFEQAIGLYRQVIKMCGKASAKMEIEVLVPLCQAWLGLGHVAWQRGDFQASMWAFERVYDVLSETSIAPDIVNSAQRGLARVVWHRGEYNKAMELATKAYKHAILHQDTEATAESLWIMGEVARMLGKRERAKRYFDQGMELYQQARILTGQARIMLSKAQMARHGKAYDVAQELFLETLTKYESLGDKRGQGLCLNGLGEIARFRDELDEAYRCYTRALEIFEPIGAQYDIAVTYTNLGLIELRRRHVTAAERYLQDALHLVVEKDYPYLLAGIGYNLALIKTMRGKDHEATQILKPVWEMTERVPIADIDFAQPLEELGRMKIAEGRAREAAALLKRAKLFYETLGSSQDLERVEALLGLVTGLAEEVSHPFVDLLNE